jgi:chromate reductase, NAD(P)H dehydrogenase (quinone)
MTARIVALAGSLRLGSYNRKLLKLAVQELEKLKAEVDVVDLKTANLVVYDGDIEGVGIPPEVTALAERVSRAQGIVISTPEYNHSIPGGLKNFIDWLSRVRPQQPFQDKVGAIMGATAGVGLTLRGQLVLRQSLTALGVLLLPGNVAVARAADAFDETGALKDSRTQELIAKLMSQLVHVSLANPLATKGT